MRAEVVAKAGCVVLLALAASIAVSCAGGTATMVVPPPPPPPTYVAPLPWIYSQIFSSSSPFHTTVAALKAAGATTLPQADMVSLWSQGTPNQDLSVDSYMYPVYVSLSTDPVKIFTCGTQYSACDADQLHIHIPSGAVPEPQADAHIAIIDTTQRHGA